MTSKDFETWTDVPTGGRGMNRIAYGKNQFVVAGYGGTVFSTNTAIDGEKPEIILNINDTDLSMANVITPMGTTTAQSRILPTGLSGYDLDTDGKLGILDSIAALYKLSDPFWSMGCIRCWRKLFL